MDKYLFVLLPWLLLWIAFVMTSFFNSFNFNLNLDRFVKFNDLSILFRDMSLFYWFCVPLVIITS